MPGQIPRARSLSEELFADKNFRALIANYVILDRLGVFLSDAIDSSSEKSDLLVRNEHYCKKRLIENAGKLSLCKKKNLSEDRIKPVIYPILDKLKLSQQNSSEWSMKYIAHFYSTHRFYHHLFYKNFFFEIQQITHRASPVEENPFASRAKIKQLSQNSPKKMNKRKELMSRFGVAPELIEFDDYQMILYSMTMIALCYFLIHFLVDHVSKNIEMVMPQPLFKIISTALLFLTAGKALIHYSLRSPVSFKEAGSAIRTSLNDEIIKAITGEKKVIPEKPKQEKKFLRTTPSNTLADDTYYESSSVAPQIEEKISTEKIKTRRSFFSFFSHEPNPPMRVQLTWDNPTIPALEGIVEMKNGKPEIDFLPTPDFSRAWSEKDNINTACKHDLFWQPEYETTDPIEVELAKIITVGHVARAKKQPGMVRIYDDSTFPGGTYKAKSLAHDGMAKYRAGLFPVARSKQMTPIKSENNPKPALPDGLQDQVFVLHKRMGAAKKTH